MTIVIDLFRAAAEASRHDVVKLYNGDGNLVNISQHLEDNLPSDPYHLVVMATDSEYTTNLCGSRQRLDLNMSCSKN